MIVNMYTANTLNSGDIGIYTVTVYVNKVDDQLHFVLYRCAHPNTPGQDSLISPEGIPQGDKIHGTNEELMTIVKLLFPLLHHAGATPSPY